MGMMMLLVASLAQAQQIDTLFPATGRRLVMMTGTTGSVEIRTWERAEIRVQVRGAGVSRVTVQGTSSLVVVREGLATTTFAPVPRTFDAVEKQGTIEVKPPPQRLADSIRARGATTGVTLPDSFTITTFRGLDFRSRGVFRWRVAPAAPASVDYVITVPSQGGAVVRGNTVDITVSGAIDTLDLSNVRGSIRATDVRGALLLTSLEGRVLVERASGTLFARTLSGSVTIRGARGIVEAQAISGGIDANDIDASRLTISTWDGGIGLRGPLPHAASVRVSTNSGPVVIDRGAACGSFTLQNRTVEIQSDSTGRWISRLTTRTDSSLTVTSGILQPCPSRRD